MERVNEPLGTLKYASPDSREPGLVEPAACNYHVGVSLLVLNAIVLPRANAPAAIGTLPNRVTRVRSLIRDRRSNRSA